MKSKISRHLIYIGAFLLILLLCLGGILWSRIGGEKEVAVIYHEGREIERIHWKRLDQPIEIAIGGNVVCADCEGVWMKEADCPDQLCVKQGKRSGGNLSIICLPNRVTIVLQAADAEMDGVAG